ncbi:MAG: GntR family transcriptional regulator [Desulfitobacteriaceae bacterium]
MKDNRILKFSPYKEKIYEELKKSIINNVLEPNTVLNEREIAQSLGISRTPVRDALKLLEFEGWVTTIPWKGTYVSYLTKEDVREVIQLRKGLEILAIELIEKVSEENLISLKSILERMYEHAKNGEQTEFMNQDKMFHLFLVKLSKNSRLIQIVSNLSDHIYRLGISAITLEGRILESSDEHRAILDALVNGNIEAAKQYVSHHLENTEKAIFTVIDKEIKEIKT